MSVKVEIDKCAECDGKVTMVRRLVFSSHVEYEGFCIVCIKDAWLFDNRDRILTLEQAQLEIIKARL
jgi:hypothetical protein